MDFKMTINGKKGTLKLKGAADVSKAAEIREEMESIIEESEITRLVLILKEVEKIDISFIQILRAARLYCQENHIYFDLLKKNISRAADELIESCGLAGELLNTLPK